MHRLTVMPSARGSDGLPIAIRRAAHWRRAVSSVPGSSVSAQQGFGNQRTLTSTVYVGPSTQRDPIGLAGGLNQYGYAGGDPVNYSDPFGLCKKPRTDGQKCNNKTGDRNLDDPDTRQKMEDAYNDAPKDGQGYAREQGGACNSHGWCSYATGSRESVNILYPSNGFGIGIVMDWHTHGNEGRGRPGSSSDIYGWGPSQRDSIGARGDYARGATHPSYIIGASQIWRLTPNGSGGVTVTSFPRFSPK